MHFVLYLWPPDESSFSSVLVSTDLREISGSTMFTSESLNFVWLQFGAEEVVYTGLSEFVFFH